MSNVPSSVGVWRGNESSSDVAESVQADWRRQAQARFISGGAGRFQHCDITYKSRANWRLAIEDLAKWPRAGAWVRVVADGEGRYLLR